MKYCIVIIVLFVMFGACSTDSLDTYTADRYIYFSGKNAEDSVNTSFFFYPGATELDVPIEISFAGRPITTDTEYELVIDEGMTTASGADYSVETKRVWKAHRNRDTVRVTLHKTAALDNQVVRLALRVKENDNFRVGPLSNALYRVVFTSLAVRPVWWTERIVNEYLGAYSEAKYQQLISATGVSDLSNKTASELRYYSLKLKYHLQREKDNGNTIMDGEAEMSVPVKG